LDIISKFTHENDQKKIGLMKKLENNPFSLKSRFKSFGYAFNGIVKTVKNEHNFWIHLVVMFLVIAFGFVFQVSVTEWVFLVFSIGFVLTAEIFNSAIEVLTDFVSPEHNPKAGLTKDMAAGAVLVSAVTAAIIGLIIFAPKLLELL